MKSPYIFVGSHKGVGSIVNSGSNNRAVHNIVFGHSPFLAPTVEGLTIEQIYQGVVSFSVSAQPINKNANRSVENRVGGIFDFNSIF